MEEAQRDREILFNNIYTGKLRTITQRFLDESVEVNQIYDNVASIIEGTRGQDLVPGTVIAEIEIAGETFKVWAAKFGKVGVAKNPRFEGHRI